MRVFHSGSSVQRRAVMGGALVACVGALWFSTAAAGEEATLVPPPAVDEPISPAAAEETVVLAGGCFWGVQGVFQHVKGVTKAVSGYAGGSAKDADYETVSSGRTGHAESVEVTFDPKVVSYGAILRIYFSVAHNPTELNRQGPDRGTQYRSAIFVRDPAQRRVAEAYIEQLNKAKAFSRPVVTQVNDLSGFYPAEAYHQNYATNHPTNPYIVYNDLPKIENLKRLFPDQAQSTPVLVTVAR